jgi:predicted MFS family arabinose efflux permease
MQQPSDHTRWLMLLLLFVARVAMGFQFQSVASTAPFLVRDLGIGYAEVGTLIGLYMLPGVLMALPGGLMGHHFGDKAVCASGLALMMAGGLVLGTAQTYAIAVLGRLLSGVGAVLFNLVLTKMATDWFAGREIVLAMAVVLASWPFGIAAGLLSQGVIARAAGWPAAMHAATALCGLALLLVTTLYRYPPASASAPRTKSRTLPPRRVLAPLVAAGTGWGFLNLGFVLFFSFAPLMLVEQGVPSQGAASWAGAALWISMVSIPVGGLAVQRSGMPDAAVFLFCCAAAAVLALMPTGAFPLLLCILFGLLLGPPPGAVMAQPARVLAPADRAAGLGIFYACYYALLAAGPALAGLLRDHTGTAAAPVLLGALMFLAVPVCTLAFRALAPAHPAAA